MAKYCPYCGSNAKEKDRFCIVCGKPLLADLPEEKKSEEEAAAGLGALFG